MLFPLVSRTAAMVLALGLAQLADIHAAQAHAVIIDLVAGGPGASVSVGDVDVSLHYNSRDRSSALAVDTDLRGRGRHSCSRLSPTARRMSSQPRFQVLLLVSIACVGRYWRSMGTLPVGTSRSVSKPLKQPTTMVRGRSAIGSRTSSIGAAATRLAGNRPFRPGVDRLRLGRGDEAGHGHRHGPAPVGKAAVASTRNRVRQGISAELPDLIAIVVRGSTPEQAESATAALAGQTVAGSPKLFTSVMRPDGGPFFDKNGLLLHCRWPTCSILPICHHHPGSRR